MSTHPRGLIARRWWLVPAIALASFSVLHAEDDSAAPASAPTAQATPTGPIPVDPTAAPATDPDLPPNVATEVSSSDLKIHPAGKIRYDREIRDSKGTIGQRPAPDPKEEEPLFFSHVDFLREFQHDDAGAADYLRNVVSKGDIPAQYRARAMLELADCLQSQHEDAEALCWLKIWMLLYPSRPEAAGVSYRVGSLYKEMGLTDMARDSFYLALAHSVNEGQVNDAKDLKDYSRLTTGTLWAMAANEYQSGEWDRAAKLFDRYQKEATTPNPISLENAAFLQADCYYQLKQTDAAQSLYEQTLKQHPFSPLALQARLRLYHLDIIKHQPEKAHDELAALIWTVRTVYPKEEATWKKQTAEMLLALNRKDATILPPLVAVSSRLKEGKTWQDALNHYDALIGFQSAKNAIMDQSAKVPVINGKLPAATPEQAELADADRELNQVLPPPAQ